MRNPNLVSATVKINIGWQVLFIFPDIACGGKSSIRGKPSWFVLVLRALTCISMPNQHGDLASSQLKQGWISG
jgi:hypothetical protein